MMIAHTGDTVAEIETDLVSTSSMKDCFHSILTMIDRQMLIAGKYQLLRF